MEVPDSSCSYWGWEVRSSTGDSTRLARAGDQRRTKEYSQRLCSRQLVCDDCIFVPLWLFNTYAIVALAGRRRLPAQAATLPACVLLLDEYQLGDPHHHWSKIQIYYTHTHTLRNEVMWPYYTRVNAIFQKVSCTFFAPSLIYWSGIELRDWNFIHTVSCPPV
jgi:hypothetical protein